MTADARLLAPLEPPVLRPKAHGARFPTEAASGLGLHQRVSGPFTVNRSRRLRLCSGRPRPVRPLERLGSTGHRTVPGGTEGPSPLRLPSAQAPPHAGTSACIRFPVFPRQPVDQAAGLWPASYSNPLQLSMVPGTARRPEGWGSGGQPHEGVGAPGPLPPRTDSFLRYAMAVSRLCGSGGAKPGTASLCTGPSGSKVPWWPQEDLCWHPD